MSVNINRNPNSLIKEKSPYLRQHAYNPVEWYPWNNETFALARERDLPVFLSVGYSTCHWCHVMAHESFEDDEVAELMNRSFVNIKVDREERPDIDNIYMLICQIMTGGGGWPLSMVMTPDKKPFFAATYIPKNNRFGRIGLMELIPKISEIWHKKRDEVFKSAEHITAAIQARPDTDDGAEIGEPAFKIAFTYFMRSFDHVNGGFGNAPKFPTPHNLSFLLRYQNRFDDDGESAAMVDSTLQKMRAGGIYDHLGYGFHRYSTDAKWLVPHFEKMLYDQAQIAIVCTEAYQVNEREIFKNTVNEIIEYVKMNMTSPDGAFYSAEDADSEGEEGKFYLWTQTEIESALSEYEFTVVSEYFNILKDGNYIDEISGRKNGKNILHITKDLNKVACEKGKSAAEIQSVIQTVSKKLFDIRKKRIHPHKDDKILTDWNGLMISAMAKAAQVFDNPEYTEAALAAADFFLSVMKMPDGGVYHRYSSSEAGITGMLDDYAFLVAGLLDLYEASFNPKYLRESITLTEYQIEHFWDKQNGGFFFSADYAEELIIRQKEIYDGAIPSGNGISMLNLLRLSHITGNSEYAAKAQRLSKIFAASINSSPFAYTQFLISADFSMGPVCEIVIAGEPSSDDTKQILKAIRKEFIPNKVILLKSSDNCHEIEQIAPYCKLMKMINGKATAYICRNFSCNAPMNEVMEIVRALKS